MKTFLLILCFTSTILVNAQILPIVSSGSIQRIENFKSKFVDARNVDVWLPDGYDPAKKYSVVYMHDGQMLFDSTQTWNKKEWGVDETFSQLIRDGKIERCIVVAIWNNGGNRISEYFPNKIFSQLETKTQAMFTEKYTNGKTANGDNYLKFMVDELKPYIDQHFSTYTDKDHTFVMGSSMGSTISLYAINEYPEVFGGAACLSTAWLSSVEPNYEIPAATFEYLKHHLASPFGHKIYMDYGTGESDKIYEMTQSFVDLIAKGKGYGESNYLSKVFEKDEHNEIAWSKRLYIPIEFLLGKTPDQKASSGKM
jgi:enterochelin esterase-like enzyme